MQRSVLLISTTARPPYCPIFDYVPYLLAAADSGADEDEIGQRSGEPPTAADACGATIESGAGDGDRTHGPLLGKNPGWA